MLRRISSRSRERSGKLVLSALIASALAPTAVRRSIACAGGDYCQAIQCESMFAPEIVDDASAAPFFYSDVGFAVENGDMVAQSQTSLTAANLQDWLDYFGKRIPLKKLSALVYGRTVEDVAAREASAQSLSTNGRDGARVLDYLTLAKRVEPIATWRLSRNEWEARDAVQTSPDVVSQADALLQTARELAKSAPDEFLRGRTHFQILRLLFYSNRYAQCVDYYGAHAAAFDSSESLKYRALDLAAGSHYRLKNFSKADYLYSLIYARYAPLRRSAYRSFHPQEEADWQQTLALARSPAEKEALWQMFGLYADGVLAIENIYALDPKSKRLPLLLVHEMNATEARVRYAKESVRENEAREGDRKVSPALLSLVRKIADAGDAEKPEIWRAALGHLLAMNGDLAAAEAELELADKTAPAGAPAKTQTRVSRLFVKIKGLVFPAKELEDYFAKELRWLKTSPSTRAEFALKWSLSALKAVYATDGPPRAVMLVDIPDNALYLDNARIDAIVDFLKKPKKNEFDAFLVENYGYTVDQLLEMKAINLLFAGDFALAADAIPKATHSEEALSADPFLSRINDCHDCDAAAPNHARYAKSAFMRKVADLKVRADGTGEEAARASFELAAALYNVTWFGNARSASWTEHGNFAADLPRLYDMRPAQKYYARALELSNDREFKAKAAFMLAKSEHNALYASFAGNDRYRLQDYLKNNDVPAGRYFELLKASYADTKYYSEILHECGYFRAWSQKN